MKSKRQKLLDELDKTCSLLVRKRDNKCILCGRYQGEPERLQSHHWVVPRARSLRYRYDPRNCVSLCYSCHILKVHQQPTVALIEELTARALLNGVCTRSDIEEIKMNSNSIYRMGIGELEDLLSNLKEKLKNY